MMEVSIRTYQCLYGMIGFQDQLEIEHKISHFWVELWIWVGRSRRNVGIWLCS